MAQYSAPPPPYESQQPGKSTQVGNYPSAGNSAPGGYMPVPSQGNFAPQSYVGGGYAPPQPGFAPIGQQTVVVTAPQPSFMGGLGPYPTTLTCPGCRSTVTTSVTYEMGTLACCLCWLMFFFACWPLCLIPMCCDSCQDANHRCPVCNAFIGTFKR